MDIPRLPKLRTSLADLTRVSRAWGSPAWSKLLRATPDARDDGDLEEVVAFGTNPGQLRMLRFVPPGLPPGAPLVVALHGCTQHAAGFAEGTGWCTLAARHGFAVLLPEQVRSNNAHTCFNWFEPQDVARGRGEVASIRAMVARMQADLQIDPARIFVTGLSAGGAMTAALLATYPDVFAAGAVIAGLPYGSAHTVPEALMAMRNTPAKTPEDWGDLVRRASPAPQRKPIVAIWHGDEDATVEVGNAEALARQWCDVHGLGDGSAKDDQVDGTRHRAWRDARGDIKVELYTVPGLAHGVPIDPGAPGDRGVGKAMPHILDVGVPSTLRIARDWGLIRAAAP